MMCLAVSLCACSGPVEFADWTIPVPEGTRIIERPAVPPEERAGRIELTEDLRLGADGSDPSQAFYRPRDVDADAEGNIYVLDAGNHRVQVYDAQGGFLRSLGREGQGPAEFQRPRNLVIAGDYLIVKNLAEMSIWRLNGEHEADYRLVDWFSTAIGRDDGSLVADHLPAIATSDPNISISAFTPLSREQVRYLELPLEPGARPAPVFGASRDGMVYVTELTEYQVVALTSDAEASWALRVAWPRLRPDEIATLGDNPLELPEQQMPALSRLAVDGHGHLYVYPYHASNGATLRPVDVYSPSGERLFSGMIPDIRWVKARDDHVYIPAFDTRSSEHHVVRYRLVEPF